MDNSALGELTTLPQTPHSLVGWGGGGIPISHPLDAFGASHLGAFGASIQTPQADGLDTGVNITVCEGLFTARTELTYN